VRKDEAMKRQIQGSNPPNGWLTDRADGVKWWHDVNWRLKSSLTWHPPGFYTFSVLEDLVSPSINSVPTSFDYNKPSS
jgi:hypothetical protein